MFSFTPLLGSPATSTASASLLELDGGIKILIDTGWDERFDVLQLQELEKHVSSISVILLTHPTIEHIGAFAHLCKHVPQFRSIPVYATSPVIALGRTLLQDIYASSPLASSIIPSAALAEVSFGSAFAGDATPSILLQLPTTEEIAGYFSVINSLKFSQPLQPISSPFSPSLDGLTITAYGAGHSLGGTIWHVQYALESIVYAVDWNQAKENTLSGAAWLATGAGGTEIIEPLRRPTSLVCSSNGIERIQLAGGRRKRDESLLEAIDRTVANGGRVLIPTDSSARVLELAYILEQHWRKKVSGPNGSVYKNAKVHIANRFASSIARLARSMMEWMDETLIRQMEAENEAARAQKGDDRPDQTPFDFRYVRTAERPAKVNRILESDHAGVILASDTSLEWGYSSTVLQKLCADPRNLVILPKEASMTDQSARPLVSTLWKLWRSGAGKKSSSMQVVDAQGAQMDLHRREIHALQGDELSIYQQYLARRRQMQSTQQGEDLVSAANPAEAIADDQSSSSSESSDEDDNERQGKALNLTAAMNQTKRKVALTDAELGINILLRRKNIYDYDVRGKRGREKMFPFVTKRSREDEYGEVVRPEDYLRAEERDEDAQADSAKQGNTEATGQKRKWDDSSNRDGRRQSTGGNKRTRTTNGTKHTSDSRNGHTNGEEDAQLGSSESESEYEAEDVTAAGPRKVVFHNETLTLNMGICYIDLTGLAEKRDLQMLIPLIKPRKLIVTAGTSKENQSLADDCRTLLGEDAGGTKIVYAPSAGETIDASVDTHAWNIKLSRELVKKLTWQNVKGLGVVAVTAKLGRTMTEIAVREAKVDEGKRKKLKTGKEASPPPGESKTVELEPVLDLVPASLSMGNLPITQPVHVGDLRLADLRRLMQANGHVAEFRGEGTLLIDGMVVVRKTADGKIQVEGGAYMAANMRYDPTASFGEVRRKIYEGLAVVAGG